MATSRSDLDILINGEDRVSPTLDRIESKVIRFIGFIGASLAAIRISVAPIKLAADFERELADVAKTTDFLRSEMKLLNDEILTMSTRVDVAATDLAKIAAAAGQQGLGRYGVEGVLAFTESVSRMASVLDITAEQAANDVGKIVNIFKIPLREIEKVVSTVNETSNRSTASGEELLDVIKRIGDAAGQLNLQEATALAATGLDFGLSPEVVGTSFTKIFTSLQEDGDVFARMLGKRLGKETDDFIAGLKNRGLPALQEVLDELRNLKPQDQQKAIVKLFGGGRIGALVNKLVQDTSNTVLRNNLKAALEGAKGDSAIKEQEKVLDTLTAQAVIAKNALIKVAVDAAESSLKPLTEQVKEFTRFLRSPALAAFVKDVVAGMGELIGVIGTATSFVASLNINWSNFIRLAQAFVALKVIQTLAAMAGNVTGLNKALKSTSKDAGDAAQALQRASGAKEGFFSRVGSSIVNKAGLRDAADALAERKAAKEAQEQAAARLAAAQREQALRKSEFDARRQAAKRDPVLAQASAANSAQSAAYRAAQGAVDAAYVTRQTGLQNSLATKAAKHATNLQAIETAHNARMDAIKATGTRVGEAAAKRDHAQAIADENKRYAVSEQRTRTHWATKNAVQIAALEAAATAERAALAASQARLDTAYQRNQGLQGQAANAGGALVGANNALLAAERGAAGATQQLGLAARAANVFKIGLQSLAGVVTFLGNVMLKAFFWVSIIYTVADMFGWTEKLFGSIRGLTDILGLSSKKDREAKIAKDALTESIRQQAQELDDLIEKNEQYINANTGKLEQTRELSGKVTDTVDGAITLAQTATTVPELEKSLKTLGDIALAAEGTIKRTQAAITTNNARELAKRLEEVKKYQRQVDELTKLKAAGSGRDDAALLLAQQNLARTQSELNTLPYKHG